MKRDVLGLMLVGALSMAAPQVASAKKGGGGPSTGLVVVSSKSFPARASSEASARAAAKRVASKEIGPTDPDATKAWEYRFNMMAFFGRPLEDTTVTVTLYDITDGTMRLVTSFEQYLSGRNQKSFQSEVDLQAPDVDVKPNRKYVLSLSSRTGKVGEAEWTSTGKTPKLTGKVVFSEDEVNDKKPAPKKDDSTSKPNKK
jgi:hypothetical protein